jgi:hypothetical protein
MGISREFKWFARAAILTAAILLLPGCSSPEKAVEGFLTECFAGDFEGARRYALPEVVDAFRLAVDETGGIAPVASASEELELESLVGDYVQIHMERRMRNAAVVKWRIDRFKLMADVSGMPGVNYNYSMIEGDSDAAFRLLVIRRNGGWMVGGVLPSGIGRARGRGE